MSAVDSGYAAMRFGLRWTMRLSISFEGALAPIDYHLLSRADDNFTRLVVVNGSNLRFALT